MLPLTLWLRNAGYQTRVFSYPSRRRTPAQTARALAAFADAVDGEAVHFVAHSLGGLVLRHLFAHHPSGRPGRVVTLGTPHRASHAARRLAGVRWGRSLLAGSLEQGLLGGAPPWGGKTELGSIAGSLPLGLGRVIAGIPVPNDGTVAVTETLLPGMADHIVLRVTHTGLLLAPSVARHVAHFLRRGHFDHNAQRR